jgi:selenocysteine-specific elongation factor
VSILPSGRSARVRAVQVHDEPVEAAQAGQRVALNLAGIARGEVARGDVVVAAGSAPGAAGSGEAARGGHASAHLLVHGAHKSALARAVSGDAPPDVTYRVDVALAWASPEARPDGGARVGVHHGTRESAARLVELGGRFFQLRLEEPIVAAPGDRLVIRALAPPDTLGGGVVLDAQPKRHGPSRDLLARLTRLERGEPEPETTTKPAPAPQPRRAPLSAEAQALERRYREAGTEPPLDDAPALLAELRQHDRLTRLTANMHVHPDALDEVHDVVVGIAERDGQVTLAQLRDALGTSRKYAQAYLEHFDSTKVTLRRGEARVLRRRRPRT